MLVRPCPARAVAKGINEPRLFDPAQQSALIYELGPRLHTQWVCLHLDWSTFERDRGTYAPEEVARYDALVDALNVKGIKVMLTVSSTPTWAGDRQWWDVAPRGYPAGPHSFTPIALAHLKDLARLGEWLAAHFRSRVSALECWNEPNLWPYLYPQRTESDAWFAPRLYLRMLQAFHAGVARAGTDVRVVAGATGPVGPNDRLRTSPQRFARFLSRHHAGRYFDVYSHHPYTPGGSVYAAPGRPPNDPSTTVTLYNLRTLLRLFPAKPFYLTEYAYTVQYSSEGVRTVTPHQQAAFLSDAYSYVRRYPQVKLLVWFLLCDIPPAPGKGPETGVYSGLRTSDGSRRPAWYAFRALPE
jgi:hypothetical protein